MRRKYTHILIEGLAFIIITTSPFWAVMLTMFLQGEL